VAVGPTVLGRYELHASIATGGMASIHLGRVRGAAGFERTVAIKRLHPQFATDPRFVGMFMDEARLVARIRHPNVVPILDVVAEQDELFLVMEYVHGESLAALVLPGGATVGEPAPPGVAAAIFVDVLHGLHAAHEATTPAGEPLGIVHRDVTPHNVLVGVDGAARIADFGIAMATERAQKTQEGQLKGKLCYIAPEQLQGGVVDRTADVYAASVSLWEALTGRQLFAGEHEGRIIERVLVGATRAPSSYASDVPLALDDVVMRGLSMRPHKRFPTARDMALAIEASVALPPASVVGAWVATRAKDKLARRAAAIEALDRAPDMALMPTPPAMFTPPGAGPVPSSAPRGTSSFPQGPPSQSPSQAPARPVSPWPFLAALFVAVFIVGGGVVWARARRASSLPTDTTPPPASSWADFQAPPYPDPSAEPPPTASNAQRPSPTYRPRPAKSASDACKPPYTRDSEGRKIYKRECL
jgi:eukaryotic-like serine/threonine-protein kinase